MGWELKNLMHISVTVSRHNSDRDKQDDALTEDLVKRLEEVLNDPKYAPISVMW